MYKDTSVDVRKQGYKVVRYVTERAIFTAVHFYCGLLFALFPCLRLIAQIAIIFLIKFTTFLCMVGLSNTKTQEIEQYNQIIGLFWEFWL